MTEMEVRGKVTRVNRWGSGKGAFFELDAGGTKYECYAYGALVPSEGDDVTARLKTGDKPFDGKWKMTGVQLQTGPKTEVNAPVPVQKTVAEAQPQAARVASGFAYWPVEKAYRDYQLNLLRTCVEDAKTVSATHAAEFDSIVLALFGSRVAHYYHWKQARAGAEVIGSDADAEASRE